jgi:hypothetical protein
MVSAHLYPGRVCVVVGDVIVASHHRIAERGQVRYDWQHYIALVKRKTCGVAQWRAIRRPAGNLCCA